MPIEKISADAPEAKSADIVADNIAKLKTLFPDLLTEGKDGVAVDVNVLKQLVGDRTVAETEEKYGLNWHGKRRARQLALTPSTGTLRPCPEESVDWDTTQNLMIEGDNLEVLKLLQKSYSGKVKLIYIDPPYNTGKDFVYPDDFQDNIKNYLELTGQVKSGKKMVANTEASGRFHTDWLNMMLPRLRIARSLLAKNGVLLISINDIEAANLKLIADEVLGSENFIAQFVWNNEGNIDNQSKIKGVHEYILAYGKNASTLEHPSVIDPNIEETSKLFNDQIENSITKNGPANPPSEINLPVGFPATFPDGILETRNDSWPHITSKVEVVGGKLAKPATVYSGWSSKNLLELFINNGCVPILDSTGKETWFSITQTGAIYGYKKRSKDQGHVLSVIRNVGTTKQNSSMLSDWGLEFSYPKPVFLLQYLVQIFTSKEPNSFVLDFFAGSGTTGHAVMNANAADRGSRRFILVQLPERDETTSEPLSQLTRKRIKQAALAVKEKHAGIAGDLGFRVYKLDSSNIREWDPKREDLAATLEEHAEHLKADRSEADILTEVLLKLGLDLCVPIEQRAIGGVTVHSIGAGALFACLPESITREQVKPLAQGILAWREELKVAVKTEFVFRDSAFADDVAKTNLAAYLEQNLPDSQRGRIRSL